MRIAAVLFLLIGANSCFGGVIGTVHFSNSVGYGNTNGGEFTLSGDIRDSSGAILSTFMDVRSFCVEKNENINYSSTFHFAITDWAVKGGVGGALSSTVGDPLDDKSRIIFNDWLDNRPAPGNNNAAGNAVQKAIWTVEEEYNYGGNAAVAALINGATGTVPGDIAVMNIFSSEATWSELDAFANLNNGTFDGLEALSNKNIFRQDQIVRLSGDLEQPSVPEPTSMAIFALGLGLMGTRRMRSRS